MTGGWLLALAVIGVAVGAGLDVAVGAALGVRSRARRCALAMATGAVFVGGGFRFGWSPSLPGELALLAGLVALAACDALGFLLPRRILYPTAVCTALALLAATAVQQQWSRLGVAAVCGAGALAVFWVLHAARPAWLGFGDVRLAGLLGGGLGWLGPGYVFVALIAANLAGALVGVGLVAAGRATSKTPLPYGVFLVAATVAVLLA